MPDIKSRLRWDFRTNRYYYCLKPTEARLQGFKPAPDAIEVRLYFGFDSGNLCHPLPVCNLPSEVTEVTYST